MKRARFYKTEKNYGKKIEFTTKMNQFQVLNWGLRESQQQKHILIKNDMNKKIIR